MMSERKSRNNRGNIVKRWVHIYSILFVLVSLLPAQKPVTIIVMGDNRQSSHFGEQTIAFRKTMKMILAENPDYIFHTGDFIRGYTNDMQVVEEWYDEWNRLVAPIKDRLFIAPGNHDIWSPASFEVYQKKIGKTYFSKDIGNAHLVLLNSWLPGEENRIGDEQMKWLEQDLQKAKDSKFRFVFTHSPAYPFGPHKGNSLDKYPLQRDRFVALLQKYNVDVLFCGHEHLYNDRMIGSVRQIITGGAGSDLYGKRRDGAFYHYIRLTLTENKYQIETVSVEDPLNYALDYLQKRKRASKAIPMLEHIKNEYPESNDIYAYLGIAYEKTGNIPGADHYFDEFLSRRGYSSRAFRFMLDEMKRYKAAKRSVEIVGKSAEKNPDSFDLNLLYARELILNGKPQTGLEKLDQLALKHSDPQIDYYKGVAYEKLAGEFYRKVIETDEKNPLVKKAKKRLKSIKYAQ